LGQQLSRKEREAAARRSKKVKSGLIGGALVALVIVMGVVAGQADTSGAGGVTGRGEDAPSLSFVTFEGTTSALEDFEGTPVVLNFWASWCPACVAEMPDFETVNQAFGDDVTFIGLDTQDNSRDAANALIDSTGVSYQLGLDPDGSIYRQFGGIGMPTTVFINAAGEVVDVQSGAIFADDLRAKINDLFFNAQAAEALESR